MNIRVITPVPEPVGISLEGDIQRLKAVASPQTNVSVGYIKEGKPFIEIDYEDAYAVPATIEAAIQAESEGMNAIVINCTADTGLAACRECVSIPVVAPTESSMHLAAQLSDRFSVLTFSTRTVRRFEHMARVYGMAHKLASVRSIELPLDEMDHEDPELVQRLFEIGKKCVQEDGAHSLIMGCTAFEIVSQALQSFFSQIGMPILILEPYSIALHQAEGLAMMNISQSKLTYPYPKDILNK